VPPSGLGAIGIAGRAIFTRRLSIARARNLVPARSLRSIVMSRTPVRPFLVAKDEEGVFRVTVRTTRFNSQGYPLVSSEVLQDAFKTQTAARTFVRETYRVESSDIASK
jgi:hypothetical protein